MLDALRDTPAASTGSTPVANHRQKLLEEIMSTSPYHTLGFNVAIPLASCDGEVRVFYI